jgi:hypothetical protein
MWSSGDTVALRGFWAGALAWAFPHVVVHDTPELVALWLPAGARGLYPTSRDHAALAPAERAWRAGGTLRLTPRGGAHSVDLYWSEAGEFLGWYVNLQDPLVRGPIGFDTADHILDLWVRPDRSWEWKDEDELVEVEAQGFFDEREVAAIRREGERVVERVTAWAPPFCDGWEDWRPDPAWSVPALSDGWRDLPRAMSGV